MRNRHTASGLLLQIAAPGYRIFIVKQINAVDAGNTIEMIKGYRSSVQEHSSSLSYNDVLIRYSSEGNFCFSPWLKLKNFGGPAL